MELTVLDLQIIGALSREVLEVQRLTQEIVAPYRSLQQSGKWLDGPEVCQLLGITKRTLQSYRAKGILCATQINRKNFFKAGDVEEVIRSKTTSKDSSHANDQ